MSIELKSAGLGSISSALKYVYPPAVLGSLQNDALLVWNSVLRAVIGFIQRKYPEPGSSI